MKGEDYGIVILTINNIDISCFLSIPYHEPVLKIRAFLWQWRIQEKMLNTEIRLFMAHDAYNHKYAF